ncbi:MAG: 50S ribosomal protein L13 [Acidobacteriota bacterium]|nr:50S ribosomal protein L13 [Acidobacteriota bacterium]
MKTFVPSPSDIHRDWWVVDAADKPLGRLASEVASRLRGKHKPYFTPFLDTGDHVIVVNADKVKLTGRKQDEKIYYRHTGHPGGLKEATAREMLAKKPERVIELAIKRMLPKGPLGRKMYTKLKVYKGGDHPHQAQKPRSLEIHG